MRRLLSRQRMSAAHAGHNFSLFSSQSSTLLQKKVFRPFSPEDEQQLVEILTSRPRQVARHIRQRTLESSRNVSQFRNAVTCLMIALQSKLQSKELKGTDASVIIESILEECVAMRQGDMAHLLFRAALRFRKYDVLLTHKSVRSLYDSYKYDEASADLMRNLGDEFRHDPQLRTIAMAAYLYGGNNADAAAIKNSLTEMEITTADYLALIEANGKLLNFSAVETLATEALTVENKNPSIDAKTILSVAVFAARGREGTVQTLLDKAIAENLPLDDRALGVIMRFRAQKQDTVAGLLKEELALKSSLKRESLGLIAESAIVSRTSELVSKGEKISSDVILSKLKQLRAVVERSQGSGDDDKDSPSADSASESVLEDDMMLLNCFESLIKGYGSLNRMEEMKDIIELLLRNPTCCKDSRPFEEAMRWLSFHANTRELIRVKEMVSQAGIRLTANMYLSLFRVLGKNYPRQIEKYYAEMKANNIAKIPNLYPVLLRAFLSTNNVEGVNEVLVEIRAKLDAGQTNIITPKLFCMQLQTPQLSDDDKMKLIKDVSKLGFLSIPVVQAALLDYYSQTKSTADVERFLSAIPHKSPQVYCALIRHYTITRNRKMFDQCLDEIRRSSVVIGEKLFGLMIYGCSFFGDADRVRSLLQEAKSSSRLHHSHFFAHTASAFAKLEDIDGVNSAWDELLQSKLQIHMEVYNKFLDIYGSFNHTEKVQEVLAVMMRNEPPNTVTATTVLDMLGKMGRISEMESVLEEMNNSIEASPTTVTYHQAMNAYAKNGDVLKMEATRVKMREKGIPETAVTFNILSEGYARAKRLEHLDELTRERVSKGIPLDSFGYTILLNAYSRAKMEDQLNSVVQQLLESGIDLSPRIIASIGSAYSFVGDVARAEHYVGLLLAHPRRTTRHIEGVFIMYSRLRDTAKMEELLGKFEKTSFIMNTCVTAFAKAGNFAKVSILLKEMEERGFSLSPNTGLILSSLLVRAGKTELAQAVLQMKSISPPRRF